MPLPRDEKAIVLRGMDDLVGAGLATWSTSKSGLRTLRLANGDIFQLETLCVRRIQ